MNRANEYYHRSPCVVHSLDKRKGFDTASSTQKRGDQKARRATHKKYRGIAAPWEWKSESVNEDTTEDQMKERDGGELETAIIIPQMQNK